MVMAIYQFIKKQTLNATLGQVWNFISNPVYLQKITHPTMKFKIISINLLKRIFSGLIIAYQIKPLHLLQ